MTSTSTRRSGTRRGRGLAIVGLVALASSTAACTDDESTRPAASTPASSISAPSTAGPETTVSSSAAPEVTAELEVTADDIAVAFTPAGGWSEMPPPVLADCTEPIVAGAPDMRGTWEVVSVEVDGADVATHEALGEIQRIEQCGDRVVITAGGIIHDMRADGTEERGVRDVAAADFETPIVAVATFEDGVHVLRPVGVPIEVTRMLDGEQLVWGYFGFTARLERIDIGS